MTDIDYTAFDAEEKNKICPSTLYLVTTPIGNLMDMSARGLKVLCECDFIAAEDTRNTRRLLAHFDIHKELISYHEHNKHSRGPEICERLLGGESCALVTDAGMPGISDPGEDLVRLCAERHITVTAVPGPCAVVTALSLSALSCGKFVFEGFLPAIKAQKKKRIELLAKEERTVILYEAPHKLTQTLEDLCLAFGEARYISLCKELTKRNENIIRTTLGEALAEAKDNQPRGEYVLVIEGYEAYALRCPEVAKAQETEDDYTSLSPAEHVVLYESRGLSHKDALKAAAADRGMSKSDFYRLLLDTKA